jgi:hypothetical protein
MDPISVDTLKTIAGQTVAIGLAVQVLRFIPVVTEPIATAATIVLGIGLSVTYTALGQPMAVYPAAIFNGLIAALAALKGTESIRHGYARAQARGLLR